MAIDRDICSLPLPSHRQEFNRRELGRSRSLAFQAWVDKIKVPQASEGRFPKPGILHDMVTRNSKYPNYNLMPDFVHRSVPTAAIALMCRSLLIFKDTSHNVHSTQC